MSNNGAALNSVLSVRAAEMSQPTPLQRIAALEGDVRRLEQQLGTPPPTPPGLGKPGAMALWTGGSLLLAQLQRRHPEVLKPYEQPAHLNQDKEGRVILAIAEAGAPPIFVFVVTPSNGDALLYPAVDPPDWLVKRPLTRQLFVLPHLLDNQPCLLEQPARFIAAQQGKEWVFSSQGELIPSTTVPTVEKQRARDNNSLGKLNSEQMQQARELRSLKGHVAALESKLQHLCRLQDAVAQTTPQE